MFGQCKAMQVRPRARHPPGGFPDLHSLGWGVTGDNYSNCTGTHSLELVVLSRVRYQVICILS